MNRLLSHIFLTFFVTLAAIMAFTACTGGYEGKMADDEDGAVMLSFRVVMPQAFSTGKSRAEWGDAYNPDPGNDFDNFLNGKQFHVVITDNNCEKEIAVVTNLFCAKTSVGGVVSYDFVGFVGSEFIDEIKAQAKCKLHIVANMGESVSLAGDPLFSLWGQPDEQFTAIPMWGVATIDFSGLGTETRFDLGDVYLLRAMAKVEIKKSDLSNNVITEIKSVSINTCNTVGYLLPGKWKEATDTREMSYDEIIHAPEDVLSGPSVFDAVSDDGVIEFYLPECPNTEQNEIKMTVTYDTAILPDQKGEIYFRNYPGDGNPDNAPIHDICRNHLYRFIILREGTEMTVIAEVKPYSVIELDPVFGL